MPDPFADSTIARASRDAWRVHAGGEMPAGLGDGTLARAFHEASVRRGNATALTIEGNSVTHRALDERAAKVAGWLRSGGVGPGDRVLLCGPNAIELVVAYLATLRAGAAAVPVGVSLTPTELKQIASRARPAAGFAGGPALEAVRVLAAGAWPVVGLGADGLGRVEAAGAAIDPVDVPSSATAILAFTSGTTGRPKGVPLSHENLLSSIRAAMLAWRWSEDDLLVHALPLSHQHGLGGVHATLLAGSRAVIHARFDPGRLADAVKTERATVLFAVPAIYGRLLEASVEPSSFASLRLAISGSAPLSPALFERATGLLGREPLERYGTTESGLDTSNPYDGPRRPGSVGIPLPGVELAIAGPDGEPLGRGSDGEILFRGPQVFEGYADREDSAGAFHPGGWFRTGDIGRVDPAGGTLTITGRAKEVIITGGLNVYPREVELALETHAGVAAAAVVGVPSERWGEEVVAFVVSSADAPSNEDLAAFARERLAAYKCPKRVLPIDELPTNAMGKVDRQRLRELAGSSS